MGSSGSGVRRPRVSALFAAWGASTSRSRRSSCSRIVMSATPLCCAPEQLGAKTGAAGERSDAEYVGDGLAEIREGGPDAKVDAGADGWTDGEHGHVLARVIGARGGGIVAVIGSNHEQIAGSQARQQVGEAAIESFEIGCVPGHVVAMAVNGVEVDQVRKYQASLVRVERSDDLVHPVIVALGVDGRADPAAGKEILDLADREH